MYVQCKAGFVEADRWDGSPIPNAAQQAAVRRIRRGARNQPVIVVRSRERATLLHLLVTGMVPRRKIYQTPAWDYEWRVYMSAREWAGVLGAVVMDLDYRNFKSWTTANKPQDHRLAHDIWHVAHEDGIRKTTAARAPGLYPDPRQPRQPLPRGGVRFYR